MTIRAMSLKDLRRVLDWAAEEGWNPGLEDAEAFHTADPKGFFLNEVDGQPAAAMSVVNHSDSFAFLGLYLCRPEFRGQGLGMAVWTAGLAHAGTRCVGLDGVPDQQANYMRSGFVRHGKTVRYQGTLDTAPDAGSHLLNEADQRSVLHADAVATGVHRGRFCKAWFRTTATRRTRVLDAPSTTPAFATFRRCREGVKVGPLHASSPAEVQALLTIGPDTFEAGPVFIDVPDSAPDLARFLTGRGFQPVFETARMYLNAPPPARQPAFYAVASLELG